MMAPTHTPSESCEYEGRESALVVSRTEYPRGRISLCTPRPPLGKQPYLEVEKGDRSGNRNEDGQARTEAFKQVVGVLDDDRC